MIMLFFLLPLKNWWRFTNADQMIACKRNFACYAAADAWGTLLAHRTWL